MKGDVEVSFVVVRPCILHLIYSLVSLSLDIYIYMYYALCHIYIYIFNAVHIISI